jgi:hypothetical protein
MALLVALFFWSPWAKPTESDWLQAYETWSESVEATLARGDRVTRASCEAAFDEQVGEPPGDRLERGAAAARRGCASLTPEGWEGAQADFVRELVAVHSVELPPREQREYSALASAVAGRDVRVYCWPVESWGPFLEQYATVRGDDEITLKGIADPATSRIDLEPEVCGGLRRYVRRHRPIELSFENFVLAEAIVVLTHEAEHLKDGSASETEVHCYAVQHVRPFIRTAGWGPGYQEELALHAWDLGYTQLPPQLRTRECRNGGPLDRHPASNAWP